MTSYRVLIWDRIYLRAQKNPLYIQTHPRYPNILSFSSSSCFWIDSPEIISHMSSKAETRATFSSAAASPSLQTPSKSKLSSSELITMIRSGEKRDEDFPPLSTKPTTPSNEDFGMKSLLDSIKQYPADKNIMAIGVEVESLGLPLETNALLIDADFPLYNEVDMNMSEDLRPRWQRKVPACYNIQPPPPPIEKIHTFSDETLFYIFYFRNSDIKLQEQASYTL